MAMSSRLIRKPIGDYNPTDSFVEEKPAYQQPVQPRKADSDYVEIVYDIAERIGLPRGNESFFFPRFKRKIPRGYNDRLKNGYVAELDKYQQVLLGQLITEKVGKRYTLIPFTKGHNFFQKSEKFKAMLTVYHIANREIVLKEDGYIPNKIIHDPVAVVKNGKITLEGEWESFEAFVEKGLMAPIKKCESSSTGYTCNFYSGRDELSSIESSSDLINRSFIVHSDEPLRHSDYKIAALTRSD